MKGSTAVLLFLLTLGSSNLVAQAKQQGGTKAPASNAAMAPVDRERAIYVALEKNDIAAFNESLGADFTYASADGVVKWERAKSAEMLSYARSVWRKVAGRWVAVAHSETPAASAAK